MSAVTYNLEINAPIEIIWQVILDELDRPQQYSGTIKDSNVLERFPGGLLREISVPDASVREKITYDREALKIKSSLVGHPDINGTISKQLTPDQHVQNRWHIQSELKWQTTKGEVEDMLRRNVKDFVMERLERVRSQSEKRAREEA